MTASTIQTNIIYGLGEGQSAADSTMLTYALRWANAAYRDIYTKYRFKHFRKRRIFRTVDGQQTYHMPSDFIGFGILKNERTNEPIEQVTSEDFTRRASTTFVDDETFTSDFDVAVELGHKAIVQYSETVSDGTTAYTRDTDYAMDYAAGTITVDSTGSLTDATDYYIDYVHYANDEPERFCLEYDSTNKLYVARLDPTPDDVYIMSIQYPAAPSNLSGSVNAIWESMEFAIERGGIFYGSLEMVDDPQKRLEFRAIYEQAAGSLVALDNDLVPKRARIQVALKRTDYYDGPSGSTY